MNHSKKSDYLSLLKHLARSRCMLYEYQIKVEDMIGLVIEKDLIDFPTLKLHINLQRLSDSVENAMHLTENLINISNRIVTLVMDKAVH